MAAHLKDFWGPEMRSELKSYVAAGHDGDVDELVVRALPLI